MQLNHFWWIVLHDTPEARLRVYEAELARAQAYDEAAATKPRLAPEVRASLATQRIFSLARTGCDRRGPCVGRDTAHEDADPILDAIRDGRDVRRIVARAWDAHAFDLLVTLLGTRGVPPKVRQGIRDLLVVAKVQGEG